MIPKIIHYCWFGGTEKPELVQRCIRSWEKFCPDYQIIEWNEKKYDISSFSYMKEAYAEKKWAFVSDVARLDLVYQNGGIYLDTDVELLAPIDDWRETEAFFVFESERNVNSGLGFGAVKGHRAVKAMLDSYQEQHLIANGKMRMCPCPAKNTEALSREYAEFKRNGSAQQIGSVRIFSCNEYSKKAVHYGAASWCEGEAKKRAEYKDTKIKRYLRSLAVLEFVERHFGKKTVGIYEFFVYDLLEMGFIYYLKRLFRKLTNRK